MLAIKAVNLTKKYKNKVAVSGLNLELEQGKTLALLGVNGAGKTTTVKMLVALTAATSGDAFIFGHSVAKSPDKVKEFIAISPQETAVGGLLTVWENVKLMADLAFGCGEKSYSESVRIIKELGLSPVKDKRASQLSGGWQRRLSIAMALVSNPKLLFLDEPTLGLDVIARSELWQYLEQIKKSTTIVLTTHYMEEAEYLSDEVAIMSEGKLISKGSAEQLKRAANAESFEKAFLQIVKGEAEV